MCFSGCCHGFGYEQQFGGHLRYEVFILKYLSEIVGYFRPVPWQIVLLMAKRMAGSFKGHRVWSLPKYMASYVFMSLFFLSTGLALG
jgi:hypothetical protein